jgi:hypothetical protein
MRRLARACLAAVLAAALPVLAFGAAAVAQPSPATILTGNWEYSYRLAGFLPAGKENKCLGPAEVRRFAEGICTNRYRCEYDVKHVADGKVDLKGVWIDKKGRTAPVTAKGGYRPDAFNLDIRIRTTGGIPLSGTMNARRISATCPAGAS